MAITSARNFTVAGNALFGNTSFIGARGPNCSASDPTPASASFIIDLVNVTSTTVQSGFQSVQDADGLTCVQPPPGGDYWPYGGNPIPDNFTPPLPTSSSTSSTPSSTQHHGTARVSGGLIVGAITAVIAVIAALLFVRRWALNRQLAKAKHHPGYVKK
jgi:hypothetical protein